ncbi:hypothetical protein A3Q56_01026 [Intoshia linei]|uniref:Transmembrane protein 138 n=1 Tax=Intoshia linei TaxID=1819745 RepID=A0A177BCG2_9BILA|nr:hypothetical protein A3Q56_01026 [Intoshia linei]
MILKILGIFFVFFVIIQTQASLDIYFIQQNNINYVYSITTFVSYYIASLVYYGIDLDAYGIIKVFNVYGQIAVKLCFITLAALIYTFLVYNFNRLVELFVEKYELPVSSIYFVKGKPQIRIKHQKT